MTRDFFDPPIEQTEFVLIGSATAERAIRQVVGCEGCSEDADIPFDWILGHITGQDPSMTDYVMEAPARCPYCCREITEKTLVIGE
jgi:hypothetical protein